MKKKLIIFFVLFLFFNFAKSQSFHKETDITWSDSRPLSWKDFIGNVDNESFGLALTASSIICKPYFKNDSIMLWVESIFIPDHSWKKRTDLDSIDLSHEQNHFNLTELFTRKLRKIINEETKFVKEGHSTEFLIKIDSIFKRITKECEETQNLYDKQTNHSMNKVEQKKWNDLIWNDLDKLNGWTFNSIFIGTINVYKE